MLSQFDKENINDIIKNVDGTFDWFTAQLLQFLARIKSSYRIKFKLEFNEEYNEVEEWLKYNSINSYSNEEYYDKLDYLIHIKADYFNKEKLINCL
jgi:hypothetical protein